jgi:glycosyltransferase involved in cell wall biosynthesis
LELEGDFVVSFAGVMGYSQDLDVILDAAYRLHDKSEIRFLLVGDGVEKARLVDKSEAMNLENVHWMPMQPRERYPAILHASDVGLATLHADVQTPVVPSKILSVMASGRPILTALDLSGDAPKLVEEAEAGICLSPGDDKALAEAIYALYQDRARCEQLGQNGRSYAEAHLSHNATAKRYETIFESLVE